ncbi:ATP-binding protein, partial [Isoptericola sp. QY 916]|nr:ATP-binding protein [Isoptericola sp. QY 916]
GRDERSQRGEPHHGGVVGHGEVERGRDLDRSYLAVQGPPGTGKTHVGSHVIAALVAEGWRVGVVAQSHAAVENMLRAVVEKAGVPADRVAKKRQADGSGHTASPCAELSGDDLAEFSRRGPGVVGGTAWDFAHPGRWPDDDLDLLVVDEAGQFSLASTIAVSRSARRLLLLGDPQQLPQVSRGRHPEPVDRSALGWLVDGRDVLPPGLGYFLSRSWRMHPALCEAVSQLAYEGRLQAHETAAERRLDGVAPGVHHVPVRHEGRGVASPEEAQEVVRQAAAVVGRSWTPGAGRPARPLEPRDVVVLAAYNAQVWAVRRALDDAGLGGVRVGTVDRFQGTEAPVAIVTLAASSPHDVRRGTGFLLSRHRINVAVSRGQWCAIVVRSPELTDYLPHTPEGLGRLGAFLGLCERAVAG